jgi:hypothetical protein
LRINDLRSRIPFLSAARLSVRRAECLVRAVYDGPYRAGPLVAVLALAGTLLSSRRVSAQPVLGGPDDATIPRRGTARVRIQGAIGTAAERFGGRSDTGRDGAREPLGADFTLDTLGARFLPEIGVLGDSLGALVGRSDLGLSLGAVRTRARVSSQQIPLAAEVGVLDRVSVSLTIPVVRTRSSVDVRVNEGGATGNLGFNPANAALSSAATASAARAQNAALTAQLAGARTRARGAAHRLCRHPVGPRVQRGRERRAPPGSSPPRRSRWSSASRGCTAPAPVRPGHAWSRSPAPTPNARSTRDWRSSAGASGATAVTALADTARPYAARTRLGIAGFQRILTDPAFGIGADSLRSTARQGTGDLELAAHVQWLDTFRGDEQGAPGTPRPATTQHRHGGGGASALASCRCPTSTSTSRLERAPTRSCSVRPPT